MSEYFKQARRCFQEALESQNASRDAVSYNFYAGLVSLASGLEVEISALKERMVQIEAELSRLQK
jgi:hypothetical protein